MITGFLNIFKLNWRYRKYRVWLINTVIPCDLYLWNNWRLFMPALNKFIGLTSEAAYLRSFQSYKNENKWLGFGRMKWNEENNIKWTTKYRNNNVLSQQPEFHKTEIWAPDWNKVCDTGMPPDIFICLYHYPQVSEIREGIIIALPHTFYKKNTIVIDQVLFEINSLIHGSKIHNIQRDWWGRTASRNNLEDMNPQEIKEIISRP